MSKDELFELSVSAYSVDSQAPQHVTSISEIKNIQNCLCVPLHASLMGLSRGFVRPYPESFKNIQNAKIMELFATSCWEMVEFIILCLNVRSLGTPSGLKDKAISDEDLRCLIYPDYIHYLNSQIEIQNSNNNNDDGNDGQRPKKIPKKKEPNTSPDAVFDYSSVSYRIDLEKIFKNILNLDHPCHSFDVNQNVLFGLQTINKPTFLELSIRDQNNMNEEEEEEEEEEDQEQTNPESLTNLLTNSSYSSIIHTEDVDKDSMSKQKINFYLLKIPSKNRPDSKSAMLIIEPIDSNYDPIQLLKYTNNNFKAFDDLRLIKQKKFQKMPTTFGRNDPTDINHASNYGSNNPFFVSQNGEVVSGSFLQENHFDSTDFEYLKHGGSSMSGIKSASILDDQIRIFDALVNYNHISEMASVRKHLKTYNITHQEQAIIFSNIDKRVIECKKDIRLKINDRANTDFKSYYHAINPWRLLTFENAISVLQYLEDFSATSIIRDLKKNGVPIT